VILVKGDITKLSTAQCIIGHFEGQLADLVVCDGAPDVTGIHDIDQYAQAQLLVAALNITTHVLRRNGTFVAKIFIGKDVSLLYSQLKIFFGNVAVVKPKSSRHASFESFVVCQHFSPPTGYVPTMVNPMLLERAAIVSTADTPAANRVVLPLLACGNLSGLDAATTGSSTEPLSLQETIDRCMKQASTLAPSLFSSSPSINQ